MLNPDFLDVLRHEFPDETRIPQLACHTEILAAARQRVRLAPFCRRRDALWREIVLFTSGDGN